MTLLLVTVGAIEIALFCDDKGKALDFHCNLKKRDVYEEKVSIIYLALIPGLFWSHPDI